ncbi:hypothetical protein CYG49_03310 [Candidatus Saccharibacteria bacterium]|nr:MAG: hypothetical protein CYG49_03310 [Candidatus Saccharibacteria bacterium]
MRSFAIAHGHQCIVVEVLRRGTKEGTDVTESSRHNIAVDIRVHNDGSLKDLEGLAARLLKDIKREKTASEYQAKQGLFGSIFG